MTHDHECEQLGGFFGCKCAARKSKPIMNIQCNKSAPTEEGEYIWLPYDFGIPEVKPMGQLITVRMVGERNFGGVSFEPYLGVVEMRGRSVDHLRGTFSDKLSFSR